ncbi:MAG: hypothetical protein FWD28_04255 [Treponema sp.]|nr:hypothetical protein [Treponema sp.]
MKTAVLLIVQVVQKRITVLARITDLKARNVYFILAALSLICGAAVYPLFRSSNLLVWEVFPKPAFLEMFRVSWDKDNVFLSVLIGSAPDFLWLLSGIFILRTLLHLCCLC